MRSFSSKRNEHNKRKKRRSCDKRSRRNDKSSTVFLPRLGRGAFTCAEWQVSLRDHVWQVTLHSFKIGFPWISICLFFVNLHSRKPTSSWRRRGLLESRSPIASSEMPTKLAADQKMMWAENPCQRQTKAKHINDANDWRARPRLDPPNGM